MFRYVLLCDGVSDNRLLPVLEWVLRKAGMDDLLDGVWANPARFSRKKKTLRVKIEETLLYYPCDLLFIHRDAESQGAPKRYEEITDAMQMKQQYIGVVPVRMVEAWLLLDERAIRVAAGNPNGQMSLTLPTKKQWEKLNDPKEELHTALRTASNLSGRRLRGFSEEESALLVADFIDDWSALRGLTAFDRLEADVRDFVTRRQESIVQEGMNL